MTSIKSKMAAEFIGTFVMIFAGCGSIMIEERFSQSLSPLAVSIVFGLAVTAMIYAVGHISGAHFNPAVTLGFFVGRHFPRKDILPYWIAQFAGGLLAIGLLKFLLPVGSSYGSTLPQIYILKALVWEIILTFILMFVIISVATDTRAVGVMAGVAIGGTVLLCALFGGPISGASMNPARSFAPNLFQGHLSVYWIYFIGPCIGAILATLAYEKIRC